MAQNNREEIEKLLLQVTEMLRKIQNRKQGFEKNTSLQMLNELNHLEKAIELFNLINKEDLQAANIDLEQLKIDSEKTKLMADKDKQLLQRTQDIEKEAKEVQNQLLQQGLEKLPKKPQKTSAQQKSRDRRNRFKPLGGNKNWIHL